MVRPVSIDRAISYLHRVSFLRGRVARVMAPRQLSILAAAFLVSGLVMTSFVSPASAGDTSVSNDSVSALRDYAQLGRNVVFAGMLRKFEIWSKERWLEEIKRSEVDFEGMGEALAGLGI